MTWVPPLVGRAFIPCEESYSLKVPRKLIQLMKMDYNPTCMSMDYPQISMEQDSYAKSLGIYGLQVLVQLVAERQT